MARIKLNTRERIAVRFALALVTLFVVFKVEEGNRNYFKNLHLHLNGIVRGKALVNDMGKGPMNDKGLLYLDLRNSSLADYDIRNEMGVTYYCVIHHHQAELAEDSIQYMELGDSVVVDGDTKSFECYRGGEIVLHHELPLYWFTSFTRSLNKLHKL